MKILITGASGFIGRHLVRELSAQGHSLLLYSHHSALPGGYSSLQDLDRLGDTVNALDAVINLAGTPIMGKRWTRERKQTLWDSRVALTQKLVQSLSRLESAPKVFLSGSAIGIYGDQGESLLEETAPVHGGFGHALCSAWEAQALEAQHLGARTVILRTGLVVGADGGFLQAMIPPFRLGLGGPLGHGQQWMSWIHIEDHIRLMCHLLNSSHASGVYNLTAPHPVTNENFTQGLAEILNRPACFRLPSWFLKTLLGEMSELLLESQRVIPAKALKDSFEFRYPELIPALRNALLKG